MGKRLFVGNLSYYVADADLAHLFMPFGTVRSVQVIEDRQSGQSKGFGFVEMGTEAEAGTAMAALQGQEIDGRPMAVNAARPRESRFGVAAVSAYVR
jgi:RNA recognition motif-containing protein